VADHALSQNPLIESYLAQVARRLPAGRGRRGAGDGTGAPDGVGLSRHRAARRNPVVTGRATPTLGRLLNTRAALS